MTQSCEPPMSRLSSVMAHSIPGVVVVAISLRLMDLLGATWLGWLDTGASFFLLLTLFAFVYHLRHGGLCLRCLKSSPLDPETEVRRNKFFLKFEHRTYRQFLVVWGACMVLSGVGGLFFMGIWQILAKLPMDVLFFSVMWGMWTHHRLTPWCPYCRGWDGGGDPEWVPDPDPAETKTA